MSLLKEKDLLNNKDLGNIPIECQRLLIKFMQFSCITELDPEKKLAVAEALSWGPDHTAESTESHGKITTQAASVINNSSENEAHQGEHSIRCHAAARTQVHQKRVARKYSEYIQGHLRIFSDLNTKVLFKLNVV